LADSPRQRSVLDEAARKAGWSRPLPAGHARGIALSTVRDVVAAHVAEISLDDNGASHVHRIVEVIDCGDGEPNPAHAQWASAGAAMAIANASAALQARLSLQGAQA
ncbi:MAG: hypothetical protein H7Y33_17975, partial [Cytophagales bacterium]|nr:hypothetical protein [Rhizobacter sp.]